MSFSGCPYYEDHGYIEGTGDSLNNGIADAQPDMDSCRTLCKDNFAEAKYFTWRSNSLACRCREGLMRDQMIEIPGVYVGVITCKGN